MIEVILRGGGRERIEMYRAPIPFIWGGGSRYPLKPRDLTPELKSVVFNKEVNKEMNGFRPMSKTWKSSSNAEILSQRPNL